MLGWGVRINERLNWLVVMLGILSMLIVICISVGAYSAATSDKSSAFGLGAFLTALFAAYIIYQYFAWKEDMSSDS